MNQNKAVCTIIAKNYIAFARTLCQSFLSFHPNYKCYVLIVDEFEDFINPSDENFEIVTLKNLEIPSLPSFCFKYNITELSTAAKAFLLEYLIDKKSINKLLYIDPDILITNSLDNLYRHLENYDIVLTPHLDTGYPDDDLLPNDGSILRSGIFNLGFIGINSSANARSFLDWWKPKLYKKCIVDTLNGYFVDQKFIDFVPTLFDNILIEKNVGYNVAYWNLHSRQVRRSHDRWECNDGPLYFFHFSSYRLEEPDTITGHIADHQARYRLSERPDVHQLFLEYKERIIATGYMDSKDWPYSYAYFKTGKPIPSELRVLYRNVPEEMEKYGDPFASPALMRQASMMETTQQGDVPEILVSAPYKYIPGLRYAYKRWIKPNGNQSDELR